VRGVRALAAHRAGRARHRRRGDPARGAKVGVEAVLTSPTHTSGTTACARPSSSARARRRAVRRRAQRAGRRARDPRRDAGPARRGLRRARGGAGDAVHAAA
jgi:hypothetical protein